MTSSTRRISRRRRNTWEPAASPCSRASPAASGRSPDTASGTPAPSSTSSTSGGGDTRRQVGVPTGAAGGVDVVDVDVSRRAPGSRPSSTPASRVRRGLGLAGPRPVGWLHAYFLAPPKRRASTSTSGATAATSSVPALRRSPAKTASPAVTSRSRSLSTTTRGQSTPTGCGDSSIRPGRCARHPRKKSALDRTSSPPRVASRPEGGRNGGLGGSLPDGRGGPRPDQQPG